MKPAPSWLKPADTVAGLHKFIPGRAFWFGLIRTVQMEVSRAQDLVSELGMSSVGWPHTSFLESHSSFTRITREVWLIFLPSHSGQEVTALACEVSLRLLQLSPLGWAH